MKRLFDRLVQSTWFKKYSATIGGFALGAWVQATYWREIRGTLDAWGVSRDSYLGGLLAIAGAAGIATSIALSLVKTHRERTAESGN